MTRMPIVDPFIRDLRYAVRVLRRTPVFTMTAIVTLALVIGACTAVFSLADAILIRPLPYPDADRLGSILAVSQSPEGVAHPAESGRRDVGIPPRSGENASTSRSQPAASAAASTSSSTTRRRRCGRPASAPGIFVCWGSIH